MKTLLQQLLAIENFDVYLVLGILIGFGLIESFAGYLRNSKRKKGDWLQEVFSFFFLSAKAVIYYGHTVAIWSEDKSMKRYGRDIVDYASKNSLKNSFSHL